MLVIIHALKTLRHYLEGARVTVVTDHRSLTYFHTQPNLSRRQARWMEFLQSFDLEIKYTPGKGNVVADALSRHALDGLQLSVLSASKAESTLLHRIKTAYQNEDLAKNILKCQKTSRLRKESSSSTETGGNASTCRMTRTYVKTSCSNTMT